MTEISIISHACFKIKSEDGTIIYTDPYEIPDDEEKADIIIPSHSHYDHFDGNAVKKVKKEDTKVIGPKSIAKKLEQFKGEGLEIGDSKEIGNIKITLVPAYTIKKSTHPKSNNWAGSIIEVDGKKIYHAGDTERIPEMKKLKDKDITVALLPCGGTYTMDMEEASKAALDISPKILIPMHNWDKDMTEIKQILAEKNSDIQVEILDKENPLII